ncbi:putative inactive ATP-dependent zinc metalloprotease FTSHI 5, chloroplastic [Sesamum alatum]|uniref:Inactive ATP-dependent zinc metalloprotease FTSHI 5, chloroplastic n=1 Tax=Sesamum alatum TaxID=300844 RepID=A0AAE2CID6_9LAMI|nr:putative inactive ATP-dependent zinc metalloprotease FTSHI 5, chloroplastic [Sesamum alatum]
MSSALTSPLQTAILFNFPLHNCAKPKPKSVPFRRNSSFFVKSFSPLYPLRVPPGAAALRVVRCSVDDNKVESRPRIISNDLKHCNDENNALAVAKPIAYALFCVVIGYLCPVFGFRKPALAAVAVAPPAAVSELVLSEENEEKGHEYSRYTRRLLEDVSRLLKVIEEAKNAGKEDFATNVEEGLEQVKTTKRALQEAILNGLHAELKTLKGEKEELMDRSEKILDKVSKVLREEENLMRTGKGGGDRIERLRDERMSLEEKYNDIWERIWDIEDLIARKETMAFSIGVRELLFIERECEALVEDFLREMRRPKTRSATGPSVTKLSKGEIQKELQDAHRQLQEQIILPSVVDSGDMESLSGDMESLSGQDSTAFALRIQKALRDSRAMQKNLEAQIRKTMKKHGEERRFIAITPPDEVVKGYPDIELKWMFGRKEVVSGKAVRHHLLHGWKKWREDVKMDLKKSFLEDPELGKKYVAERQERILWDRDRVASRTWYNEQQNRWELDPIAVPYAISKKLVENARIRHDWAAMYVTLKGNDEEYFVDVKELEVLFEDFGGFDALYLRMVAAGIPTSVQLMWIPLSELDFSQQFLLLVNLCRQCFTELWRSNIVTYAKEWTLEKIRNINDDIMVMIVFPLVEFVIPYQVRMRLGMAWPEYSDVSVGPTWYLKWQSEAEARFKSRKRDGFRWHFLFLVRTAIYGYVLFHVFRFLRRKVPRVLGFGPLRRNPNLRKLRRVKAYFRYRMRKIRHRKKDGVDPISTAFEHMKRIKNPPIRLKDFASVESMREEINEVVAFLQNPNAFQEMGARAPRGVLLVGERGTGKTSLALAIAAEARVPVVEVKAQQLEAGLWVGQSASNVRELFQTARDLAPVIILVEDFELFAGVRGKFIHTKKQDHEAFINQLLVELDGFEKQDGVVLMATTRNLKQIDEALRRPGRMDRIFHLQQPTQAEREKILRLAANETMDENLIDFVDWRKVAEKTALLRAIELKCVPLSLEGSAFRRKFVDTDELMSYCSWFATFSAMVPKWVRKTQVSKKISKMLVNHLGLTLTKEDLQNVVDLMEPYGQITNGIELLSPPLDWTRETKLPHAVWAAGRGLMALLLPNFDVVDNLWLESSSWEGIGCTKITKTRNGDAVNGNVETRAYLEKKLVFCFGSYVASQLLLPFGEENILSSSELKEAQEIATRMVIQYGWGPDDSPTIYHHGNAVTALSMGDNFEYEMAAKVERIYDLAYDKARMLLQKNYLALERIVEELLEYEILTGKDLERIVAENGGIREKEPFFLSSAGYEEQPFGSLLDGNAPGVALLSATN